MRILATIIASAAALAACSQPTDKAAAPQEPAVAPSPPGRPAAYAAAQQSPEAFVRALYAMYGASTPPEAMPPGQEPLYSRMMNARIGADAKRPGGEPMLDYDPVCDCQDVENLTVTAVAVAQADPRAADASVGFTNAGETKQLTLKLVKEGPMWKVDDVLVEGRPPLSEAVMRGL
jgi:hypothetical protein